MGRIEAICIASYEGAEMQALEMVEAKAGQGLLGDHHFSEKTRDKDQITLIEAEALEQALLDSEVSVTHAESRRNLLTRGAYLNHLVGQEFQIGEVRFRGIELCEPCGSLQKRLDRPVIKALLHRGGLRAQILSSGTIRIGDAFVLK